MYCSEFLKPDTIEKMLGDEILNPDDLAKLSQAFEKLTKRQNERFIYLLYNDYIGIEDAKLTGNENDLDKNAVLFSAPYGNMKHRFLRDRLTTLDYDAFGSDNQINTQISLIGSAMTGSEIFVTKCIFGSGCSNAPAAPWVRRASNGKILHAKAESTKYIAGISKALNDDSNPWHAAIDGILRKITSRTIDYQNRKRR